MSLSGNSFIHCTLDGEESFSGGLNDGNRWECMRVEDEY